jgi:hypothetical protein
MDQAVRRPFERRVTTLLDEGVAVEEVARRFGRSPDHIRRVAVLAELDRSPAVPAPAADGLRPLERRLLRWRDEGVASSELAPRFRRSAGHLDRVEDLARLKLEWHA